MSSPAQQIIDILLQLMKQKQFNTTSLSQKTGIEKRILKRVLSGKEELTVNQMMMISAALELNESDLMGLPVPSVSDTVTENSADNEPVTNINTEAEHDWEPDQMGIQAQQIIQYAFGLGIDLLFVAETSLLKDSGVPEAVLKSFAPKIPIRLDAAFHHHYRPEYYPRGLEIRLSFDAVYTCFFPWEAINQVTCFVHAEPFEDPQSEESSAEEVKSQAPFLRVVK